jgi:hypothetical protein
MQSVVSVDALATHNTRSLCLRLLQRSEDAAAAHVI